MIKAVFFDVGGTLIEPNPSVGSIYSQVANRHSVSIPANTLQQRFKEAWKKHKQEHSLINKNWWKTVVFSVFEKNAFKFPDLFFDDLYAEFEKKECWRIFPDVIETLEALRMRSIRLAVASNWDSRLPSLLKTLDLNQYFEHQFVSYALEVAKPNPNFFTYALNIMQLEPLEAIHVGDDPVEDAKGAESAGIRAYLIDRTAKPKNSRALSNLMDILVRI